MSEAIGELAAPRVGVDLVRVDAVQDALTTFGHRYLDRIFTAGEQADSESAPQTPDTQRLAARFAAKEATLKVLRPERHWFDWRQIEVVRHSGGWVELALHGAARAQAEAEGLHRFSLSLSHEHDYAIAVVCAAP